MHKKMSFPSFAERLETHNQAKNVYVKFDISQRSNDFAIFAVVFFILKTQISENK